MTKNDIVNYVSENTSLTREQASEAANSVIAAVRQFLIDGESVYLRGFATFKLTQTAPKAARDILRNTTVQVPSRKKVKLVLGRDFNKLLNP